MRALLWASRILLFLFLFTFAAKNTDAVSVRFFLGAIWHAPLIIVLLAFFVGGAALAVLSLLGTVINLRRRVSELQRELTDARLSVALGRDPIFSSLESRDREGANPTRSSHDD